MEDPPKKFFRLKPGGEVRLRNACIIRCDEVIKNDAGEVVELRCTFDPETRSGLPGADRKVKGTIHWVSAADCADAPVRLYDRLFTVPRPDADKDGRDFTEFLNPESLSLRPTAKLEAGLGAAAPGEVFQFERLGYFVADASESRPGAPVFNRIVTLRDSWAKLEKAAMQTLGGSY